MSTIISRQSITSTGGTGQQDNVTAACDCGCCFGSRALMLRRKAPGISPVHNQSVADTSVSRHDIDRIPTREALRVAGNTIAGITVAFFPKCPICWAGYMSLFSAVGLRSIPYTPQLLLLFIAAMASNLYIHYRMSRKKKRMGAFALNLIGVTMVVTGYFSGIMFFNYTGIILLIISSLIINLRRRLC